MHQQEDSRRACCSLSSTASRTAGSQDKYPLKDKRVAMSSTNKGRTVQIQKVSLRPENDPKRGASSHTEELVILESFLKKTKTDDLIHQIRQKVTERRDTEAKKQKKKMNRSCVPGCTADARCTADEGQCVL